MSDETRMDKANKSDKDERPHWVVEWLRPNFGKTQYMVYLAGCLLFSFGACCFIEAKLGTDPLDVFSLGLQKQAPFVTIGLIPEIKHSTYFASIGLPIEPRFLAVLRASAYLRRAPVIVQSFEVDNLKALRAPLAEFSNVQAMQLVEPSPRTMDMLTPAGLAAIAGYADWVAPPARAIIPLAPDGRLASSLGLVAVAHKAGLLVGTWTFRPENRFLPADFRNGTGDEARNPAGSVAEMRRYIAEGLDGFFTDDPALGRQAVDGS